MQIKSVKLDNIRSYINQEINFNQGSTLLSGDIGSGKTTILLAIEFCLFGMRRDLSGTALLRNGEEQGSVELNLEVDGKNITIKRTLKKYKDGVKQTSGYIISNNTRSDLTAQEIKARVLELLGYPQTLLTKSKNLMYRYTVYTQQEDMKQILLDDKDHRVDTLRKVFAIDKYKNIRQNSLIYIKNIKDVRNILKGRTEDLENKKQSLENKSETLKTLSQNLNTATENLTKLDLDNKKIKFKEIETKLNEYNQLNNQLNILKTKIQEKNNNKIKQDEDINNIKEEINKISLKINNFKLEKPTEKSATQLNKLVSKNQDLYNNTTKQKNILTEKLTHLKTRINEIKLEIETKSEKIKDLKFKKQKLETLESDLEQKQKLKQSIAELNETMNTINLKLKEFQVNMQNSEQFKKHISNLDTCPACLQVVSIDHKFTINQKEAGKIAKLNILMQRYNKEKLGRDKEFEELNKKLEELQNKEKVFSQMQNEIKNLEEISVELNKKKKILINFNQEFEKTNLELGEINKIDLTQVQNEIKNNKELLNKLNEYNVHIKEKHYLNEQLNDKTKLLENIQKQKLEIENQLKEINKQLNELNDKLKDYGDIDELFSKQKQEFDELLNKHRTLLTEKARIETEHKLISQQISELKIEIQDKEKSQHKIVYYNQIQNWLENYFIKLMSVIEKNVMFSIYQQFNDIFQDWFNVLMENEDINVRLDEEFTPIIEQNGYDIDFNHLSGGERTSVALAYRLALNKVVNQVQSQIKTKDILILDEPTDGFSTEQLDKVRLVLDELDLAQVIIVSHESKIESFVENVVHVNKTDHVSEVIV